MFFWTRPLGLKTFSKHPGKSRGFRGDRRQSGAL
jgi:hypothetical protein